VAGKICLTKLKFLFTFSTQYIRNIEADFPLNIMKIISSIDALGDAIHHVHAKDTYVNQAALNLTGRLDTIGHENVKDRAWSYITLGYGHGEQWWREFCYRLRLNGYDGWLSIEHEDVVLSRMEGMRRSIDLLKRTLIGEPSDYALPAA
jgi:sugar phosphate isomerase/epimerase